MKKEHLMLTIAAIIYGVIIFGGQIFLNMGYSVYEISVYSIISVLVVLLPLVLIKRKYMFKKEMITFFAVYGFIAAGINTTQYAGLIFGLPVSVCVLLLYSQPIWTTIFGRFMLNEEITKKKILAIVIAMTGIIVTVSPWKIESVPNVKGVFFAILAGIFLSLWVIFGRKSGIKKQHYITTIFGSAIFSLIWLLIVNLLINQFFNNPMLKLSFKISPNILFLFLFGVVTLVIGHSLFYKAVEKVEASKAGVILMLEPVSATALAAIFLGQAITLEIVIGGALILLSNYIIER